MKKVRRKTPKRGNNATKGTQQDKKVQDVGKRDQSSFSPVIGIKNEEEWVQIDMNVSSACIATLKILKLTSTIRKY